MYQLSSDDPRCGHYASDESIERWPELMITGRSFNRTRGGFSIRRLSDQYFAVIPANFQGDITVSGMAPKAASRAADSKGKES